MVRCNLAIHAPRGRPYRAPPRPEVRGLKREAHASGERAAGYFTPHRAH